jgi:hypothetical protein
MGAAVRSQIHEWTQTLTDRQLDEFVAQITRAGDALETVERLLEAGGTLDELAIALWQASAAAARAALQVEVGIDPSLRPSEGAGR